MRKCKVFINHEEKRAWFHKFYHESRIVKPSAFLGGHDGGCVEIEVALVETEDGHIHKANVCDVCFIDPPDGHGGRLCEYFVENPKPNLGIKREGEWKPCVFHAWSTDYEEFESGPGLFPTAIVEDETGCIHSVYVENVRFPKTEN